MTRSPCLAIAFAIMLYGCASPTGVTEQNGAIVNEGDGTVSFYRGKNIAARLSRNERLDTGTEDWIRMRVGNNLLSRAAARANGLLTISMEEPPAPGETVEVTFYTNALQRNANNFEIIEMTAGGPFITGYAQVISKPGEEPMGFYDVKRFVRNSIGWNEQMWTSGMHQDPDRPALRLWGGPFTWPNPLPENWQ